MLRDDNIYSCWDEYIDEFSYFSKNELRPLCKPVVARHVEGDSGGRKAVVLIHGLSDSPYSMWSIGSCFYRELGYDVYLPLLQCHGLNNPGKMRDVSLAEWKRNVQFAIEAAGQGTQQLAIGGFSTGGALGVNAASADARITGGIYLFSAAFGLYGGPWRFPGRLLEKLLLTPLGKLPFLSSNLVSNHPYRYRRVPVIAARELVLLMRENRKLMENKRVKERFYERVFSAWSESDHVVDSSSLAAFGDYCSAEQYVIPARSRVAHAELVLEESVYCSGERAQPVCLETANPHFADMLERLVGFERDLKA